MNFSRNVEDLSSPVYKICPFNNDKEVRVPYINITSVNVSLSYTLRTYPYLIPNLHPDRLTELLGYLSQNIKEEYNIVRYNIIGHNLYIESYPERFYITEDIRTLRRNL